MKINIKKLEEIVYREDLYPRIKSKPETIQKYALNIEVLPPIEINQDNILIDGFHRWTAHKKAEIEEIKTFTTETKSDVDLLALAIERNSTHGYQLEEEDKRKDAIRLYNGGIGKSKDEISKILSVTGRTINSYLSDIDKHLRKERKEKILSMYLACYSQQEIADEVNLSQKEISKFLEVLYLLEDVPKGIKHDILFENSDFTPPLDDIWNYSSKTNKVSHFGNTEQRIVDNLLYLYTEPFDIVLDPFAGGGATIDVCKKRFRRYYISDLNPIIEREKEIRQLDIVKELPPLNKRWSEVKLTYLDPPYWRQAEGQYSDSGDDLANMPLDEFTDKLAGVVKMIGKKQSSGVIALIIQPTLWKNENKEVSDHVIDLIQAVKEKKIKYERRFSCPYSTEQFNAQMINYSKENKTPLVRNRELIIWRCLGNDKTSSMG